MKPHNSQVRRFLPSVNRFLETRPPNTIVILCLLMALALGGADVRGSSGFLMAYVIPVAIAGWYGGTRAGAVISLYCALAWLLAVLYDQRAHLGLAGDIVFLTRLAIFLMLSQLLAKLRESMRQQRELVQFIVHDLRSPISSAITGLATLGQSETLNDATDREMVELALVSNERALGLVNSMLDLAKLEMGRMKIGIEKVSLDPLVAGAFEQVALWAKGAEVRLVSDVQVFQANLDPALTTRVLVNLLSNAIKFSPLNSEVRVTVVAQSHGGRKFLVKDNGKGIPHNVLKTIFEPFFQVQGTKGGTGLGLTFCRLAVQAQGGRIWAESSIGRGTTVCFTLPNTPVSAGHHPHAPNGRAELEVKS